MKPIDYLLILLLSFIGIHASYWAAHWEWRLINWLRLPRCIICGDKCRNLFFNPVVGKPSPMCALHFKESVEMHVAEERKRYNESQDREGEEWKDGPRDE